ncbi:MAG: hypothetical protein P8170_22330 [Gemmatimonadota bacterium]
MLALLGHFRVTYPERMTRLAPRIGAIAEKARAGLADAFLEPPDGKIDLLVTDATDYSNGFAQVTPSNRITVYARPPIDEPGLGYFDDWLELVVTHELAHIVHLDRTGTLGRLVRGIFGRVSTTWPFFPGLGSPRWTIEGLATWYESSLTDAGRIRGTHHDMVLRTAALEGRFEGLDQAAGDAPVWPGGERYYAYGARFFEHLLDKFGEDRMGEFASAVAGQWVPYRLDAAGRAAFGSSLSEEWRLWSAEVAEESRTLVDDLEAAGLLTHPEPLTRGARVGYYPRVSPDGSALAFTWSDGRSDSKIRVVDPGSRRPVWDARTNGIATFDWLPGGDLLVAQYELDGPYRIFSDLYRFSRNGRQLRLTRGERLSYPSSGPDGRWAVAVRDGEGTTTLVRVDLANGGVSELLPPEPEVHWTHPAVSPDGRWIAASRWRLGGYLDVVILDQTGRVVLELTRDRAMDLAPGWSPDGSHVVWSSDRTEILNLLVASVDPEGGQVGPIRMVTHVATGVSHPSVDPTGQWIYVSAYHVDGWEVERVPFQPGQWTAAPEPSSRFAPTRPPPAPEPAEGQARPYSALPTLVPRYWEPLYEEPVVTSPVQTAEIQLRSRELLGGAIGAQTSGRDLVGRHAYDAWARVFTSGGKVDFGASYSWAGLGNPVLSLSASQFWGEDGGYAVRASQAAGRLRVGDHSQAAVAPGVLGELRRRADLGVPGAPEQPAGPGDPLYPRAAGPTLRRCPRDAVPLHRPFLCVPDRRGRRGLPVSRGADQERAHRARLPGGRAGRGWLRGRRSGSPAPVQDRGRTRTRLPRPGRARVDGGGPRPGRQGRILPGRGGLGKGGGHQRARPLRGAASLLSRARPSSGCSLWALRLELLRRIPVPLVAGAPRARSVAGLRGPYRGLGVSRCRERLGARARCSGLQQPSPVHADLRRCRGLHELPDPVEGADPRSHRGRRSPARRDAASGLREGRPVLLRGAPTGDKRPEDTPKLRVAGGVSIEGKNGNRLARGHLRRTMP